MKASDWIDLVKVYREWESDYRAAKELKLSRNTISMYRTRTPTMDEEVAVAVARALEIDAGEVVLDQVAERAKNPVVREALQEHLLGPGDVLPEPGYTVTKRRELERQMAAEYEQQMATRGKRVARGGGSRVDITSVTQATLPGGDPDTAVNGVRIVSAAPAQQFTLGPFQKLVQALQSLASYTPPLQAA